MLISKNIIRRKWFSNTKNLTKKHTIFLCIKILIAPNIARKLTMKGAHTHSKKIYYEKGEMFDNTLARKLIIKRAIFVTNKHS